MRFFLLISCFFLFSLDCIANNIPFEDRVKLCSYHDFINEESSKIKRNKREELCLKLIGIIDTLGSYRRNFLEQGTMIDLFPTAYYHTTVTEMYSILNSEFTYPIEKMEQMIAFFDAYQFNRNKWETNQVNLVEDHWKTHFEDAVGFWATYVNFGCSNIANILETGITAHVDYDLPRAIRFAFMNRLDKSITKENLFNDFQKTDSVFSLAKEKTQKDVASVKACSKCWQEAGEKFLGWMYTTDSDVITNRKEAWDKAHNSEILLGVDNTKLDEQPIIKNRKDGKNICDIFVNSTLFLFDLSGSMNEKSTNNKTKLEKAQEASLLALDYMNTYQESMITAVNDIAIAGFSGVCKTNPINKFSEWESDADRFKKYINGLIAGGGTPLIEAISQAKCKLINRLRETDKDSGKLIILSDGEDTCGQVRPDGIYSNSTIMFDANDCSLEAIDRGNANANVKYNTIGFGIKAGSKAERDLQYLSSVTGGKYMNAQGQKELERAFRKFNRIYIPKLSPALGNIPTNSVSNFVKGVSQINEEAFTDALMIYNDFVQQYDNDCNGVYNLALMQEANDIYQKAIDNYQKYLSLCPNASDRGFVEQQIVFLEEDFKHFIDFQKKVIISDLEYLKLHFEKAQNSRSEDLAAEFRGFLSEKGDYYNTLPELIGQSDRLFKKNAQEVARGLNTCSKIIRENPKVWDRDGIPMLSMTYRNLKRLVESL